MLWSSVPLLHEWDIPFNKSENQIQGYDIENETNLYNIAVEMKMLNICSIASPPTGDTK